MAPAANDAQQKVIESARLGEQTAHLVAKHDQFYHQKSQTLLPCLQVAPVANEAQKKVVEAARLGEQIAALVAKATRVAEQSDELEAMAVRETEAARIAAMRAETTPAEHEVTFEIALILLRHHRPVNREAQQ